VLTKARRYSSSSLPNICSSTSEKDYYS
jgi:hypothetical protein